MSCVKISLGLSYNDLLNVMSSFEPVVGPNLVNEDFPSRNAVIYKGNRLANATLGDLRSSQSPEHCAAVQIQN